jgi:hypothetical protein
MREVWYEDLRKERVISSELERRVPSSKSTEVSQEHGASIFKVEE